MFIVFLFVKGGFGDGFVEGDEFVGEMELLNFGLEGVVFEVFG